MNEFMQKLRLSQKMTYNMELEASKILVHNQIKIFIDTMENDNDKIVWTNMVMPTEILYAADLIPIQTELVAGWMSTLNLSQKYIQIAHAKGYNLNLCSYHKTVIGALESGILPPPKFAVLSSHICDGGSLMVRYFKERFHTKVILLDIPYYNTPDNRKYISQQLIEIKKNIEEYTGQVITNHRLNHAITLSNQARRDLIKANELRKAKTLFHGNLAIRNMFGVTFLLGSELGADVAKMYYEELKNKRGIGKKTNKILWIHFAPLYAGNLMSYFEEDLQCVIAFDITGHIYWDKLIEEKPIESLAQKIMSHFFLGDSNNRIELYKKIISEYKINGVVIFMQQGCRAIPCSSWEIKEIKKIPILELYGDCIDSGSFSLEQMKLRMEAFAEGLDRKTNFSIS